MSDDPAEVDGMSDDFYTHNAVAVDSSVHEHEEVVQKYQGPRLEFSCDGSRPQTSSSRVLINSTIDECSTTRLTIRNTGSTCVYYSWQRESRENSLRTASDGVNRFFLDTTPGCVLPGGFVEVNVSFSSPNAGIFTEPWQLVCHPALPTVPMIALCGKDPAACLLIGKTSPPQWLSCNDFCIHPHTRVHTLTHTHLLPWVAC